jgi:hypothetical protein
MYSQYHFIQIYNNNNYYYYLQSKVQKIGSGYDYFWCTYWYDCTQLFGTQVSNLKKYHGNIHKSKSRITKTFWTMVLFKKHKDVFTSYILAIILLSITITH